MKNVFVAAAFAVLALVGCASPSSASDSAAADSVDTGGLAPMEVTASWRYVVTGTPTIGNDATTPVLSIRLRVADQSVRADHPGFDGLERPYALIPKADGTSQRVDLPYTGSSMDGYISLHPVDEYELDTIWLTPADLPGLAKGVVVALDTNVGVVGGDSYPVSEQNP